MRKIVISLFAISFLFSCKAKKPIAILVNSSINLDTIKVGNSKSTTVTLKNIGNGTLNIENFQCSCECTVLELLKNTVIKPQDSLNFKISAKGYKDDIGKLKNVICTFKTNSDSIFTRLNLSYFTIAEINLVVTK